MDFEGNEEKKIWKEEKLEGADTGGPRDGAARVWTFLSTQTEGASFFLPAHWEARIFTSVQLGGYSLYQEPTKRQFE